MSGTLISEEKYFDKADEFVMVGDSTKNDIEPAKRIGAYYIKVGKVKSGEMFEWYSRDLSEIPQLIEAINNQ